MLKVPSHLCIKCRGSKYLCGLSYCPIIVMRRRDLFLSRVSNSNLVEGFSPPTVFVGRRNYPKIIVYPSTPPIKEDTSYLEDPSQWLDMSLEDFLSLRLSIVRGGVQLNIYSARDPDRVLLEIQELALSSRPVSLHLDLERPPRGGLLSEYTPPLGPWSFLRRLRIESNPYIDRAVSKVYYDTDLRASEAVIKLYNSGVDVNRISRILSVGAMGVKSSRRLVPTRWAITAVDSIVSEHLIREIKRNPIIDRYMVYVREAKKNLFIGILAPTRWMFEWGEAWFPSTTWNMWGVEPEIEIDYELHSGRSDYPSIGGCYYASRLAVAEALVRMNRQASAILWREIYPGFDLPVGVWFVRENIREMFRKTPLKADSFSEVLDILKGILRIPLNKWLERSYITKILLSKSLDKYSLESLERRY